MRTCAFVRTKAQVRICAQISVLTNFPLAHSPRPEKIPRMAHTPTAAAPATHMSLTHLVIPHEQLAAAIRAAFDTLVALINDKKAHLRERRLAAVAILRLASPPAQRTRSVSDGPPPSPITAPPPSPSGSAEGDVWGGRGEGSPPPSPSSLQRPVDDLRANRTATPLRARDFENDGAVKPSPRPVPCRPPTKARQGRGRRQRTHGRRFARPSNHAQAQGGLSMPPILEHPSPRCTIAPCPSRSLPPPVLRSFAACSSARIGRITPTPSR